MPGKKNPSKGTSSSKHQDPNTGTGSKWFPSFLQSQTKVNHWKESMTSDHSMGIRRQDLHPLIQLLGKQFSFPTEKQAEEFTKNLEDLAVSCKSKGITSTIYGDLDEKVSLFGFFHFVEESDGLVSMSYAVHTLEAEMATPGITSRIINLQGVHDNLSLTSDRTSDYLANSALEELRKMGVTISGGETAPMMDLHSDHTGASFPNQQSDSNRDFKGTKKPRPNSQEQPNQIGQDNVRRAATQSPKPEASSTPGGETAPMDLQSDHTGASFPNQQSDSNRGCTGTKKP